MLKSRVTTACSFAAKLGINMGLPVRRPTVTNLHKRRTNEGMRLLITSFVGIIFGFYLGVSFPMISLTKVNFPSSIFSSIDLTYIEDKYSSLPNQALLDVWSSLKGHKGTSYKFNNAKLEYGSVDSSPVPLPLRLLKAIDRILDEIKFHGYEHGQDCYMLYAIMRSSIYYERIWVPTNPRGAERLPPGIIVAESDLYIRRLWGYPSKDVINKPRYLFTFTVGYDQKNNIDAAVRKLTGNFTVMLFHYDGRESEWNEFEWSKRAIHVSARKQAKWWYAKRFLHPDIVVPYDYIFIWDEDLGVQNFDPEEYIKLVNKHDLHISQPGLSPDGGMTWEMTRRREDIEVHKSTEERPGWCTDPRLPPCAAFVEIMAPVFSRDAWRCVWHLIQNDLVHGWGLDFALRMCAEPAHEKIGVVDSQWIVHQTVPSLGNQGEVVDGRAPWEGVRERCRNEWAMFHDRLAIAERRHFASLGFYQPNSTAS